MTLNKALLLSAVVGVLGAMLLCVVAPTNAAAIPITMPAKVPEEFKDFLPTEVTDFYNGLSESEKNILKEMAENHGKYATEEDALKELKEKSDKLYNKAVELRKMLNDKLALLDPAAKAFIDGLIESVKKLKPEGDQKPNLSAIRTKAREIIEQYKGLGDDAKKSLKEQFPKITGVIQNEKFQKLAEGLLKTSDGAAAAAAPAA